MVLDMENPPGFFLLKYIIDQTGYLSIYLIDTPLPMLECAFVWIAEILQ